MKIEGLDLYALKYFFDAVEAESVTRAADRNYVTRSAVSQAIARLESWAGLQLTTHERRLFTLTDEGRVFYRKMKSSYVDFQKSIDQNSRDEGSLKIGCSASLVEFYLLPAMKKLKPLDSIHLITGTSDELEHRLRDGTINIALSVITKKDESKQVLRLREGVFALYSASGKPSEQIVVTEDRPEVLALKSYFVKQRHSLPKFLSVASWSIAIKLAQELECSVFIPDYLRVPGQRLIPLRGFKFPYAIVCSARRAHELSDAEHAFLKFLGA